MSLFCCLWCGCGDVGYWICLYLYFFFVIGVDLDVWWGKFIVDWFYCVGWNDVVCWVIVRYFGIESVVCLWWRFGSVLECVWLYVFFYGGYLDYGCVFGLWFIYWVCGVSVRLIVSWVR